MTQLEPQVWYAKARPILGLFNFVSPDNYVLLAKPSELGFLTFALKVS